MAERKIEPLEFDGETIYIEVTDVEQTLSEQQNKNQRGYEEISTEGGLTSAGEQVRSTIRALASTVRQALSDAQPNEWTLEINLGFNSKIGIPFVTEGEANGAVKVTAKWTRS